MMPSRRQVIAGSAATGLLAGMPSASGAAEAAGKGRIAVTSVALRSRFPQHAPPGAQADLTLLRWPSFVKETFGLDKVELWSQHFDSLSLSYCRKLREAAEAAGTEVINVQMDGRAGQMDPTDLSAENTAERLMWVNEIKRWMDRSRAVGAPSLRANTDRPVEGRPFNLERVADSFRRLAEYGEKIGITILVENHGGYSRDLKKVEAIVKAVDHPYCRALADWGNSAGETTGARIDRLAPIMPDTVLISAKGKTFEERTWAHRDYDVLQMTRAAEAAGFDGIYSVELYAIPEPSDPVAAVNSMIVSIRQGIEEAA